MDFDFNQFEHHPMSEKIVQVMQDRTQSDEALFYRLMVANHFAMAAAQMRCDMRMPEGNKVPVNMYSVELAPSNFGKSRTAAIMTDEVLNQFSRTFVDQTFPILSERNIDKLAVKRANRRATDPDEERETMVGEYNRAGPLMFCFDSGTGPGAKQLRHKLLLADAGALNLIVDEIGLNMGKNSEMIDLFMELYDGKTGNALNKNTKENPRNSELKGVTPANMLLFGTDNKLFDGGFMEAAFLSLLKSGYARRCFFSYVDENMKKKIVEGAEALERAKRASDSTVLEEVSDHVHQLADIINNRKTLIIPDTTAELMYGYKANCEKRAMKLKRAQNLEKTELESRFFKTIKLAGAYAFIDDAIEISVEHLKAAIKVAEESGEAFIRMLTQDKPHVKLAKHIADLQENVTHSDLTEDLSFYPRAANQRADMLTLAISWGYKHNVLIKKEFTDGIEFLRGETLEETNLNKMILSYSDDIATGYQNETPEWDELYKLTQATGYHWVNHHLEGGHRTEDTAREGFNMVVIDVDGGVDMSIAKELLKDYKALFYTTKRHDPQNGHRFRIILPTNYVLKLDKSDYKQFMQSLYDWLPFDVDDGTGQRARKWLAHAGHYEYVEGELLDVLPFIPKTTKNQELRQVINETSNLDNLERWFINNIGDGNRNNQLLKFAMVLVDAGNDFNTVRQKVLEFNNKLPDKLEEQEIMNTIMVSAGKAMARQHAA